MKLGILAEDQDDRDSLKIILRKLGRGSAHRIWVRQGDMLKVDKVNTHINTLRQMHPDVNLVLIFLDSEGKDPAQTKKKTEPSEKQLNKAFPRLTIRYVIVDHSLEGWLCCDQDALRKVIGPQAKVNIKGNPENDPRPAKLLEGIFEANGRDDYSKGRDNPKIAEAIENPRSIARRSPTFQYLVECLGVLWPGGVLSASVAVPAPQALAPPQG